MKGVCYKDMIEVWRRGRKSTANTKEVNTKLFHLRGNKRGFKVNKRQGSVQQQTWSGGQQVVDFVVVVEGPVVLLRLRVSKQWILLWKFSSQAFCVFILGGDSQRIRGTKQYGNAQRNNAGNTNKKERKIQNNINTKLSWIILRLILANK